MPGSSNNKTADEGAEDLAAEEAAEGGGSKKRGKTFKDEKELMRIWEPHAARPIWMPKFPADSKERIESYTKMEKMWRDLHDAWPKLTFNKSTVKDALKLLLEKQVATKVWHRELTELEVVEYMEANSSRFIEASHHLSDVNRKRSHVGWVKNLLHPPKEETDAEKRGVVNENCKADDVDEYKGTPALLEACKFDWSNKVATRMKDGVLQKAGLDALFVHEFAEVVMCRWGEDDVSVVDDVEVKDLPLLQESVAPPTKNQAVWEKDFLKSTLRVTPDKASGSMKIMLGGKQKCQIVVKNHAGQGAAATALLIELAEDVAACKVDMQHVKPEKEKRWKAKMDAAIAAPQSDENGETAAVGPPQKQRKVQFASGSLSKAAEKDEKDEKKAAEKDEKVRKSILKQPAGREALSKGKAAAKVKAEKKAKAKAKSSPSKAKSSPPAEDSDEDKSDNDAATDVDQEEQAEEEAPVSSSEESSDVGVAGSSWMKLLF